MLRNNNIRKRVMSIVNSKIESAQKEYDSECARLDEAHLAEIEKLNAKLESEREAVADDLVQNIVGKFI